MGSTSPELNKGPFLTWDNENKPYNELATLDKQNLLLDTAKENPYGYATLAECMHAVEPYLFLPIEEEKYFDEIVAKLRDYQKKMYTYEKDEQGKTIFVQSYRWNAINQKLLELLQGHILHKKYGFYAVSMVLSRKNSKSREKARSNIRPFLVKRAQEKIWNNWKRHHKHDIIHMTQKRITDVFAATGSLDVHVDRNDLQKYPPRQSAFPKKKKPNKPFDKTSLTSLFQRTGDGHLDNLLDCGREVVDPNSYPTMRVKPTYILLRKHVPHSDYDRPRHYQYMPYMHVVVKKYYNQDGTLKEPFKNNSTSESIPSIKEIYGSLIA